jgi:hypothetical protein
LKVLVFVTLTLYVMTVLLLLNSNNEPKAGVSAV